jgi:hypothetical protein
LKTDITPQKLRQDHVVDHPRSTGVVRVNPTFPSHGKSE